MIKKHRNAIVSEIILNLCIISIVTKFTDKINIYILIGVLFSLFKVSIFLVTHLFLTRQY